MRELQAQGAAEKGRGGASPVLLVGLGAGATSRMVLGASAMAISVGAEAHDPRGRVLRAQLRVAASHGGVHLSKRPVSLRDSRCERCEQASRTVLVQGEERHHSTESSACHTCVLSLQ